MVLDNIEKLVNKYENGETSLSEEQELRLYFSQKKTAPHLKSYKTLFNYYQANQNEDCTKKITLTTKKNYKWLAIAAIFILSLGIYFKSNFTPKINTVAKLTDKERATFYEAKHVLSLIGTNLDKGLMHFKTAQLTSTNFTKGAKNIVYAKKFTQTTNKLLKQ